MLLALAALGALGLFWGIGMAVRDGRGRANEAGTLAQVSDFAMTEEAPTADHCQVQVSYSFEVDGQRHTGQATQELDRYKAEQACSDYEAGTIVVFYDPANPQDSWLKPRTGNVIVPILVAAAGASLAGVSLVFYNAG